MDRLRSAEVSRALVAEASAWFAEFRDGAVPYAARVRFDEWLRRSPEHIQAYLEVSVAWSELPVSDPERRIDVEALVDRARASADENVIGLPALEVSPAPARPGDSGARHRYPKALAIAASFMGLLVVGLATWWVAFRADSYATGLGEQRTLRLADGSVVELNAQSKVSVRLSRRVREIELERGQALFQVATDRARPFMVRSGVATVRAVGTQFDVYRKATGTSITVLEGKVAVLSGVSREAGATADTASGTVTPADSLHPDVSSPILLSAGEQVTVTPRQVSKPRKADVAAATGWTEHRLIFEATPLAEVADEFNRYNVKKLVIVDAELASLGVSGMYSSTDPESLIGFLRALPMVLVTETPDEIHLTRRASHRDDSLGAH